MSISKNTQRTLYLTRDRPRQRREQFVQYKTIQLERFYPTRELIQKMRFCIQFTNNMILERL